VGVDYRFLEMENKSTGTRWEAQQFALPIAASIGLRPSLDLVLSYPGSSSRYDSLAATSQELQGFGGVNAHLFYRTLRGRLLLSGGVYAPVGSVTLSNDEFDVATVIGHPVMGFRARQPARGFEVTGAATLGGALARGRIYAVGVGFTRRHTYELRTALDYNPASELSVSAGLDLGRATSGMRTRLDATAKFLGTDEVNGKRVFEEGDRLELQATVEARGSASRGRAILRYVTSQHDKSFSETTGDLVSEPWAGRGMYARGSADRRVSRTMRLGLDFEWNHRSGSARPGEDGNLFGIGPSVEAPWAASTVRGRVLASFGRIEAQEAQEGGVKDDVVGIVVTTDLLWRPAGGREAAPPEVPGRRGG
jgi:hypothetical protein